MAEDYCFYDPLSINLVQQTSRLVEQLPQLAHLRDVSSRLELLNKLSRLLATSGYTITIATLFRPILVDLCARWLSDAINLEDKLEAAALLLEIHPEVFPILSKLLKVPYFARGPLQFTQNLPSVSSLEAARLHRLLLAYYRILHANNDLPQLYGWSLNNLSRLFWEPHPDPGVRFLAIRCYSLQSGMVEAERVKMEQEVVGDIEEVDCPIHWDAEPDGSREMVDGWIVPMKDAKRVFEARQSLLHPQKYYTYDEGDSIEPIHPAELSPLIVNIHGVLMLRSSSTQTVYSPLVHTPTSAKALRELALHLSLNMPTLLTSPPSSGKSILLTHLAASIYPDRQNQIVTINLADTSLDPRSLLGSYVTSPTRPGTFEWKEGVIVRAMREGRWVVFEDIDRGSSEVLGLIKPLLESLGVGKWIGGQARMEVPGRGFVRASESFAIFATKSTLPSRSGQFSSPTFFGAHKLHEVVVETPTHDDLCTIVDARFPRLAGAVGRALIHLWEAVRQLGSIASTRDTGMRELEKLCLRVETLLPSSYQSMEIDRGDANPPTLITLFPNPTIREEIFFDCKAVFFGAGATTAAAKAHVDAVASTIADYLGLSPERRDWVLAGRVPEYVVNKDVNGTVTSVSLGRNTLVAAPVKPGTALPATRSFAMHKPAITLLSHIASAISLQEPILLTGETGTGKTSVVTHLASLLRKPLISLNLSNQTEASDIVGGFKPVDARVPATELYERFLDLFGGTFSRKKNALFEESVRKAVQEGKWKRAVALWLESTRLAKDRIQAKLADDIKQSGASDTPRKRMKMENGGLNVSESSWLDFERDVRTFEVQHAQGNGKFAFAFVEGPLIKALRMGHWILLDEVNLASAETLECVSSLLHGPTASITLTEQGSLEPVPRHPEFRLFACMNPATDVGKKDLPPNIRSRFTEIDVSPPDADKETLLSIVAHYIGPYAVGDKGAVMDVAEFYSNVRTLAERREIADGSNHRPHFSMRTLARALTFAADIASAYSLRRALWEGCLMAFTMVLDEPSAIKVTAVAQKHILAGVRNPRSLLSKQPSPPQGRSADDFMKFGPFYLERGPLPEDSMDEYIMTPSVETKLVDLARIILTRRFPVLIEGPTSSGKTSSIEYLARRTGHRFVRINNHEHTDIQEYIGTYVSDPSTGKLVFKDGLLVRALRNGDWIVLDELNLAPTDVLEALNRLLDDNRELVIPETQEVVKPHPHFILFATQNPPGLYGGRKVLSRAFRNRFLEVHFEDVPQAELETILCQRCRIAPSYGQRIVAVFQELQKRRQSSRIFESKHGFATLRDLFRWAGRDAIDYQELADNGYMLLAERARREEDKKVVKDVIESIMKVTVDPSRLYALHSSPGDLAAYLGCTVPEVSHIVWTSAMQRLFTLVARALRFNEPVLLVGETGCGKTSVCQLFAEITGRKLYGVNCHQNTETADLIGSLRPVRNRALLEQEALSESLSVLRAVGHPIQDSSDVSAIAITVDKLLQAATPGSQVHSDLAHVLQKLRRLSALFEWHDGPLIQAMHSGDVFLMDEISLADDSVLERLNSVLETGRTIVLAEQGGAHELPAVRADENFKLVATMNPGGDYGKKELSPALRNRFTEIWVPAVDARQDLELIIRRSWRHQALEDMTSSILDFAEWLSTRLGDHTVVTLRDILAWTEFVNVTYNPDCSDTSAVNSIFHHAAHMTFLDGLGSLPQLSTYSLDALKELKQHAIAQLQLLFPLPPSYTDEVISEDPARIQLGSFAVSRGPLQPNASQFSFQAPTTRDNVNRVVRACQLSKPILLEGSPGVGKTSLVAALANVCGYHLCRINLSDQTDLVDLFGSDLPVEGGAPGQFAWKDAEFLRALQEGHWVLLDEMNLAPQAILEGLNAVLDHRGTVYIPELGRSFTRHPAFRIFAAQNPLQQGGGRKGLPKSFLNRFTKVYIQELTAEDTLLICRTLFPSIPGNVLQGMITYTSRLNEEAMAKRSFAREGSPWEFNLRDVMRWGSLIQQSPAPHPHPADFIDVLFLQRFRTQQDRAFARNLFNSILSNNQRVVEFPTVTVSSSHLQIGLSVNVRGGCSVGIRPGRVLISHSQALQALSTCITQGWLAILTGPRTTGKSTIIRLMAHMTGNVLQEIFVNGATDATDILGSFEEVDSRGQIEQLLRALIIPLQSFSARSRGSRLPLVANILDQIQCLLVDWTDEGLATLMGNIAELQDALIVLDTAPYDNLTSSLQALVSISNSAGRFEWVDGPLVRALKAGHWVLLDDANLCNPSVLDRLNALCENNGVLALNERGAVNGEVETVTPHPNFRLFMTVDTHYGELSRAMRNRGVEIALLTQQNLEDSRRISDFLRLTPASEFATARLHDLAILSARLGRSLQAVPPTTVATNLESFTEPTARLLHEDAAGSVVLDTMNAVAHSERADVYLATHCTAPSHLALFRRFIQCSASSMNQTRLLNNISQLLKSHVLTMIQMARDTAHSTSDYLQPVLAYQPLDLLMIPELPHSCDLSIHGRMLSSAITLLRMFVTLELLPLRQWPTSTGNKRSKPEEYLIQRMASLIDAVVSFGIRLCKDINILTAEAEYVLTSMTRLLSYAEYLLAVGAQDRLDHSAVYVASRWFAESFRESNALLVDIEVHAKALDDAVTLTSGLGLSEIWSSLATSTGQDAQTSKLNELDDLACRLPEDRRNIRPRIFDLMNLEVMRSAMSETERQHIEELTTQLQTQLADVWSHDTHTQHIAEAHPMYLVAELMHIASLNFVNGSIISEIFRSGSKELLNLAVQDPQCSLSRFTTYQCALWQDQAGKLSLATLASIQQQWLESIWTVPMSRGLDGPTILFAPVVLESTVSQCTRAEQSLKQLPAYEDNLQRHMQLIGAISASDGSRLSQIRDLTLQFLWLVISCFRADFSEADWRRLQDVWSRHSHTGNPLPDAMAILICTNHLGLRSAINNLSPLAASSQAELDENHLLQGHLGAFWIASSRLLLELFIPSSPIDPAALRRCSEQFWHNQKAFLSSQITKIRDFLERTTGNTQNGTIQYLERFMDEASTAANTDSSIMSSARDDLGRLHMYWSEVHQFMKQVLSHSRIDGYMASVRSGDPSAPMRENIIQSSISAFCQRLNTVYHNFNDINVPLQLALFAMKFGLRLATISTKLDASPPSSNIIPLLSSALAFPSVASAGFLRAQEMDESVPASFSAVLVKLTGILLETKLGSDLRSSITDIMQSYDQAFGLWSIDRTRAEEREKDAQTLYRNQNTGKDPSEAELEEEEFLAMFPEFEDLLESNDKPDHTAKSKIATLVSPASTLSLLEIHKELFTESRLSVPTTTEKFVDERRSIVRTLMDSDFASLPESLDAGSFPFQLNLTYDCLQRLGNAPQSSRGTYDFYFDENIPEIRKAIEVVQGILQRLDVLISQWPDQMVLQHLRARCDALMQFSFRSPVAKVLSALEQLLFNVDDWQMYASRDNSLKNEQQALITLIISWRRLELSAWQGLLERQASSFASATSEWWFRLYDATIRGIMHADERATASNDVDSKATEFLEDLIPLIDEFMTSSTLGQFQARVDLLHSMEVYAAQLALVIDGTQATHLQRVQRILYTTRQHYSQFSPRILETLSDQRKTLEKEIRGFIKLASWKDVNVHALKQSAQKTHRHLYKIIRKFRDVLRRPVNPLLSSASDSSSELSLGYELNLLPFPSLPTVLPTVTSVPNEAFHLLNLQNTLRNFTSIIQQRILPSIITHSSHSVESLADDIMSTSQALSSNAIPPHLDAARRTKFQKNLLTRKKKACSDFLKEFKRAGIPANVKPEVLQQHRSKAWAREQPIYQNIEPNTTILKADKYLYRLLSDMPDLRAALSDHHPEIPTRDLQRALGHSESVLSIAIRNRSSHVLVTNKFKDIRRTYDRLCMISNSPRIAACGSDADELVTFTKTTASQLSNALTEMTRSIQHTKQAVKTFEIPHSVLAFIDEVVSVLDARVTSLTKVSHDVRLSSHRVLLQDEYDIVTSALRHFDQVAGALRSLNLPQLRAFIEPILAWLENKNAPKLSYKTASTHIPLHDSMIDVLLTTMQKLLAIVSHSNASSEEDSERDNYIRDDADFVQRMAGRLDLQEVSRGLDSLVSELSGASESSIRTTLGRLLPFLQQYMWLIDAHLDNQANWSKALFKLNHVLCSTALTIAKDGFCQPKESEEGAGEGEGQETAEGAGLGEGTGTDNVSKEIQEESQVEGLQGEDGSAEDKVERADEGNAIEMSEDFGGELQDVPEVEDDDEGEEEEGDQDEDPEERHEELNGSEENAVDEKLWGDEQGPDQDDQSGKTNSDHSKEQTGNSETVAKEGEQTKEKEKQNEEDQAQAEEEREAPTEPETMDDAAGEEQNGPEGEPADDYAREADTLDLPENLQLEDTQEMPDQDIPDEIEDDAMDEDGEQQQEGGKGDQSGDDMSDVQEMGLGQETKEEFGDEPHAEEPMDTTVAEADTHAGDGPGEGDEMLPDNQAKLEETQTQGAGSGSAGQSGGREGLSDEAEQEQSAESTDEPHPGHPELSSEMMSAEMPSSSNATGTQKTGLQSAPQARSMEPIPNPLRSLGDALKEVIQRFNEILDNNESEQAQALQHESADTQPQQLEYIQEDDTQTDMQALGPARQDEVAKLRELKLLDDEQESTELTGPSLDDMVVDEQPPQDLESVSSLRAEETSQSLMEGIESALTPAEVRSRRSEAISASDQQPIPLAETIPAPDREELSEAVEMEVREWHARGHPSSEAEHIWRHYESLTHDLSYALCEQLRLILEPTMATRLKGDYRTGKRLNMKKIIPYIASEYTKDKIWLRRTRPSQREYQVLIALDDSRSMSESHSVHLAFQTLALVSKALSRLEVGDVAIAKFGQSVNVLHGFEGAPFTSQSGAKIMDAFRFDQKATQVLSLLETSLTMLEHARERRSVSSSSAADLWQLEIIISDGICQDHERLRTVLRKAEEQRVMVVFIILDSLHSTSGPSTSTSEKGPSQNSILSMNQVAYKDVSGRMELTVARYLDTFPFEYYVVVRDVEALPEVLGGTLKQFFERISEQ